MGKSSRVAVSILFASSIGFVSNAQVPANLKNIPPKYDRNGNGIVEKGSELNIYLLHKRNSVLEKYDIDLDGVLSPSETQSLNETFVDDDLKIDILDAEQFLGTRQGVAVGSPVKPSLTLAKNQCHEDKSAILLRSAYFTPSVFGSLPKTDKSHLESVTPATFSFSRNNVTNNETLTATGALSFVKHRAYKDCPENQVGNLKESAYSAGIVFDRSRSSGSDDEGVDNLTFNLNGDYFFQGWPVFDSHNITASAALMSDFGFRSAVISTSANWQPTHNRAAIGVARRIDGLPISFRWQPRLALDFRTTLDSGSNTELMGESDRLFISPSISAQLFLENDVFKGTFFEVNYQHSENILDGDTSFDFFEGSLNIPIDSSQHFLFQARYRDGNLPSSRQAVDDYLLGLGVRF
ncbi:hypothetical protein N9W89_08680 [Hellea sp.]|nr:hypothetical protein [Hellea sp.]